MKKKVFAKLCENAVFSGVFSDDQVLFDGKARLFLPEFVSAPKESLMFPIKINGIAYEVSIKFVGSISLKGAIECERFKGLAALLAKICGNQPIEADSVNPGALELDGATLTGLSGSSSSPQLAIKSVQSILPECSVLDLANTLGFLNDPVSNFKLHKKWQEDTIVGLRVSQILSGRVYGDNHRIVSLGMAANSQPMEGTEAFPNVSEYYDSSK